MELLDVENDNEDVLLVDVIDDEEFEIEDEELVRDTKLDDAVELKLDDVIRVSVDEILADKVLELVVLLVDRPSPPPGGGK